MAGGQREPVVAEVVEDLDLVRLHDELLADQVAEAALHGVDQDLVARLQLVQAVERGAVGGPVAGDGGVAGLAGQGSR